MWSNRVVARDYNSSLLYKEYLTRTICKCAEHTATIAADREAAEKNFAHRV